MDDISRIKKIIKEEDQRLAKEKEFLQKINLSTKKTLKIKTTNLDKIYQKKGA